MYLVFWSLGLENVTTVAMCDSSTHRSIPDDQEKKLKSLTRSKSD